MKSVVFRAPILSRSGYGVHARQVARWLMSRKDIDLTVQPVRWGNTTNYTSAESCEILNDIIKYVKQPKEKYDVSLQLQLPNEWAHDLAHINIGMTAGVETDICNPDWLECISKMDLVIVPSNFTKDVFKRTVSSLQQPKESHKASLNKIVVIPESYPDVTPAQIDLNLSTSFNFLLVGQFTGNVDSDRKNLLNSVKWFCEAFDGNDDVGLVLKTNKGRDTKIDRQITRKDLALYLKKHRKSEFPKIHFLHGTMSEEELMGLYSEKSIKAFYTATRGEGFGLPLLEAASAGLPIIAPNWSGYLDFLNLGKFVKLDFELKQIPKSRVDNRIFINGSRWAEASEIDVKRKLKKFRDKSSTPTQWAKDLSADVKNNFSFEEISKKYDTMFEGLI